MVLQTPAGVFDRAFEGARDDEREAFWDELRALFASADCTPQQLSAVAIANGPGGFTGLRVSVAVAKALALARSVRLIELPSALVFAHSDALRGGRGPWLVALAAKNNSAWCVCARTTNATVASSEPSIELETPSVLDSAAFTAAAARIAALGGSLLADEHLGSELTHAALQVGLPSRGLDADPAALAALASRALARDESIDPLLLAPTYAREPEAITKWRERHGE